MGKRQINRAEKAIRQSFIQLMTQYPFESITATAIIEAAKYSRRAFYTYYKDKYDLASKIMEDEINNFVGIIMKALDTQNGVYYITTELYDPAYNLFAHVYDNKDLYGLILKSKMPGFPVDKFCSATYEEFKKKIRIDSLPCGINEDFYFYVHTYIYIIYIKYWEKNNFEFSPKFMAEQVTHMNSMNSIRALEIMK